MKVNDIIVVSNQRMRVLDIYSDAIGVVKLDKTALPILINKSEFEILTNSSNLLPINKPFELMTEKEKQKYEKNLKIVRLIEQKLHGRAIYERNLRNKLFDNLAYEFNMSKTQVKNLLIRYLQNGRALSSLIPSYPSTRNESKVERKSIKGGFVVDANAKVQFDGAIKKHFLTRELHTLKYAYEKLIQESFSESVDCQANIQRKTLKAKYPSYHQFRYYYLKHYSNNRDVVYKRYGSIVNKETNRTLDSNVEADKQFLSVELDSTIADFYVIFNQNDTAVIVGRPSIYIVSEVISRKIFIYVTLENFMSETSAINALYYFMTGQEDYYKLYDIEIENDLESYVPLALSIDRGEFKRTNALSDICSQYNIRNNITPAYRGSLKPIVERSIGILNSELKKHVIGTILKDKKHNPRTQQDYRLKSNMTLKDVVQLCYKIMKQHNEFEPVTGFLDIDYNGTYTPNNIFQFKKSQLGVGLRRVEKREAMNLLLPSANALVTVKGIKFKNLFYMSKVIFELGWIELANTRGNFQNTIRYNPVVVDSIFIYINGSNVWSELFLSDRSSMFRGKGFMETDEFFRVKSENISSQNHVALEERINMYDEIDAIKKSAKKNKSELEVLGSKADRVKSIKDNRKEAIINEQELHRKNMVYETDSEIIISKNESNDFGSKSVLSICKKVVEQND